MRFSLWCFCFGALLVTVSQAAPTPPGNGLPNGQPVRRKITFNPKHWTVTIGIASGFEASNIVPTPYLWASPPAPGPAYQETFEVVDPSGTSGPAPRGPATFNHLGKYFGRTEPERPSPEEMAQRRNDWLAFKAKPWAFPRFLRAFRHIPPEISRKVLQHQQDELLSRLYRVLSNESTREQERFAADYHEYLFCLRFHPWPTDRVMTRLFLQRQGDQLFYDSGRDDHEAELVTGPETYHAFLLDARDELKHLTSEREQACGKDQALVPPNAEDLAVWIDQERTLWDFDRWMQREWAKIDFRGYHRAAPFYARRDSTFIALLERLTLEGDLRGYINRELSRALRAPADFFSGHETPKAYVQYLREQYPDLVAQGTRVAYAEAFSEALDGIDGVIARRNAHWKALADEWLAAKKPGVTNPEAYARNELSKLDAELREWKRKWIETLRANPSLLPSLFGQLQTLQSL